ncbi:MAG: hypothetical protein IJX87_06590 [Clostridia bacterium]|nr:hypothetical protein [Clostridia bacterium]
MLIFILFSLNTTYSPNLLSASPALGFFLLIVLFFLCFLGVHIAQLAKLGWSVQKKTAEKPKTPPPEPQKEKAPPPKAQEPVYYIVERKQKRSKARYSEPKEIRFKE